MLKLISTPILHGILYYNQSRCYRRASRNKKADEDQESLSNQKSPPKKEEGQELKYHLRFQKKRRRKPQVKTEEPQEQQPKERPKSVSWMYHIYIRCFNYL